MNDANRRDEDFDSLIADSKNQVEKSQSRITKIALLLIILGGGVIGVVVFTPLLSNQMLSNIKVFVIGFSSILVLMGVSLLIMRLISEKQLKKNQSNADES